MWSYAGWFFWRRQIFYDSDRWLHQKNLYYTLKYKSEAKTKFETFKNSVEKQTGNKIKILRSDNGTEFCNTDFKKLFNDHGIQHQTTVPYTPQQNDLAEAWIGRLSKKHVACCSKQI